MGILILDKVQDGDHRIHLAGYGPALCGRERVKPAARNLHLACLDCLKAFNALGI